MKFVVSRKFEPERLIRPAEYVRQYQNIAKGIFEVGPTAALHHFVTSVATSRAGYSVAKMAINSGLRIGPMMSFSEIARANRGRYFLGVKYAPVVAGGVSAYELSKTKTGNLGMQSIPGSSGGYTNPMGGGSDSYYPFKGFFDLFS